MFADARDRGKTAFIPFLTAGDPTLEISMAVAELLLDLGVELGVPVAVEIGFPYSDPIADGPTIQDSYNRALAKKIRVESIFQSLSDLRSRRGEPLVAMISNSLVERMGTAAFLDRAVKSGLDGAIVPDLPLEESAGFSTEASKRDFRSIAMVAPTTPLERRRQIARQANGFIYYVSVAGITGERTTLPNGIVEAVADVKSLTKTPICVGFGISRPEHVAALRGKADGVIVGSALVRRIGLLKDSSSASLADIRAFARSLMEPLA